MNIETFRTKFARISTVNEKTVKELEEFLLRSHPENIGIETICSIRLAALKACKTLLIQNAIIREYLKD